MATKNEKISESMEGNTNKKVVWTLEKAIELYEEAENIVKKQCSYIIKEDVLIGYEFDFIGELIDELSTLENIPDCYYGLMDNYLPEQHPNNNFKRRYSRLKKRLETNCYSNTKKGIINTAAGIMNLKSNHGWTDRLQQDVTTGGKSLNAPLLNIDP